MFGLQELVFSTEEQSNPLLRGKLPLLYFLYASSHSFISFMQAPNSLPMFLILVQAPNPLIDFELFLLSILIISSRCKLFLHYSL